jgi:hypothetical protein
MVTEDLIKDLRVMFNKCFDVKSDVRSNDVLDVFGGYARGFVFDNRI